MADASSVDLDRASVLAPGDPTTLVELLFFAYRDFTGEPDDLLTDMGSVGRITGFCISSAGIRDCA